MEKKHRNLQIFRSDRQDIRIRSHQLQNLCREKVSKQCKLIPIRTANITAFEKYSLDVSLSVILQSEYLVAEPIPINEPMANNNP